MYKILLYFIMMPIISVAQQTPFSDFHELHSSKNEITDFQSASPAEFGFSVYKHYVSSQDANRCVYQPSCSVYALQASEKYGLLRALPRIFDRLARCNHEAAADYPKVPHSDLALDEP